MRLIGFGDLYLDYYFKNDLLDGIYMIFYFL